MKRYEDEKFYYIRKPHGMPTTFGAQFSFLEEIAREYPPFFAELEKVRSHEDERGLLNRLDNETAGLLYFAKTREVAERYHGKQEAEQSTKRYVCDVKGDMQRFTHTESHVVWTDHSFEHFGNDYKALCVTYPLMHHAFDDQKMIIVRQPRDAEKGRGKQHIVKTYFLPLYYDAEKDVTTAYAIITKGIRHQIRAHAMAIGYPLIGDALYKGPAGEELHLRSVGLSIE